VVQPDDRIEYLGKVLGVEEQKVYLLMNKPKDVVTTVSDEKGRKTVIDVLRNKVKERVYPVGRLDKNTTGLLLLTNDGELAKKLSHPSYEIKKFYQVVLDKEFKESDMEKLKAGLNLEDGLATVDGVDYMKGKLNEVGIELHSGKNRIIRRMFEHLGYQVIKLDRLYYAGLTKKDLPRGWFRHLSEKEIIMLKHFT
jgi:23S rRNA pseudouridine2605 synthase